MNVDYGIDNGNNYDLLICVFLMSLTYHLQYRYATESVCTNNFYIIGFNPSLSIN